MSQNQQVQEIKERLPIEEVVSRYVKLERSGINLKGLCPFHNEKSPSFFVAPHRGSFMCFGCGKKGDVFTFIQEIEGLEFYDALKQLAEQAGVTLETRSKDENKQKKDAYAIHEKACLFYESYLYKDIGAQEYLANRGLTDKTIRQFRIGYVPDEWNLLYNELKQSFDEKDILESGLVIKNESGRIYDRFRGRIMFPIFDSSGKVIAFTGRVLIAEQKETPKYVNSPETQLFSKSHVLYGLNLAKQAIRKHNFAILVEGQMDVIMSHQMGYANTVASSGTAFTQDQLQMIAKLTPNLVLAFDSDGAGLATTAKVWEMAVGQGLDVKIAYYEGAKDPADTIKENSDDWRSIVKGSIHIIEFVTALVAKIADERKRLKAYQDKVVPLLRRIKSYSEQNFFVEKVARMLMLDNQVVWQEVKYGQQEEYQKKVYVQPEKVKHEHVLRAYVQFFGRENPGLADRVAGFLKETGIEFVVEGETDEKRLFEIENLYGTDPGKAKADFRESLSHLVLTKLRDINKKLLHSLHANTESQVQVLKQIESNKKLMHSVLSGDCQFINDMV